jgi:hypothetical protein
MGPSDVAALAKVRAKKMSHDDLCHAFKGKVRNDKDGRRYTIDLKNPSRRELDTLRELRRPYAKAATEFSRRMEAKEQRVAMRHPRGHMVELPVEAEAEGAKQGLMPASRRRSWRWLDSVRKFAPCPRRYFDCGHYTETAGETVCSWCMESE